MDNIQILLAEPVVLVDLLLNGLLVGAIFALAAYGMALVWGVMNIINVAQGEFVLLGGYVTLVLAGQGMNPLWGVPVAALVLFAIGWGLYPVLIKRIVGRDLFTSILATFGISILIQQLCNQVFGADVQTVDTGLGSLLLFDGRVVVSYAKLLAFGLAMWVGLVLWMGLRFTRMGRAIRATAQNARAARVLGVDTGRVYAATYAVNAAVCGAAGALVVMIWTIHPYIGLPYTVRSFMVVVVAGLGNLPGVVIAGLGLGAAENTAGFLLGAEYQVAFVFLLMVAILIWRNWRLSKDRKVLR